MNIALIILIPLVAAFLVLFIFIKKQATKDENKDNTPKVKRTKEEVKEVIDSAKSKSKPGRKPSAKKVTADKPKSKRGRKPKK